MKQYVPPEDIASKYGVSEETIRRMLRKKEIPGTKVGRQWRCDPKQVEHAIVASNTPAKP